MKKTVLLMLATALLFLMCGCGAQKLEITGDNLAPETAAEQTTAVEETKPSEQKTEPVTGEEQAIGALQNQQTQSPSAAEQPEATQPIASQAVKSENKGNGSYVFGMILLLLLSGAGLYFSYLIPKRIAERKRRARARQAARRTQAHNPQRPSPNRPSAASDKPVFRDGRWV